MTDPQPAPEPVAQPAPVPLAGVAPIAVQLYTLREEAKVDFAAVVRLVGAMGFVGVELAGLNGLTPAQFVAVADEAGVRVCSAHLGNLKADAFEAALDDLQAVGCDTVVAAFLPPASFADLDAVRRSADALNVANAIARGRGLTLGYHNHWWEFETMIDGRRAWSHLFEMVDPTVFAELDLYWATVGGADPVDVIGEVGERVRLLHVKDGPADDPKAAMVAVGDGAVDIARVLHAAPAVRWHIVELDRCDTDMATAVERSYRHLVSAGLSRGRGPGPAGG